MTCCSRNSARRSDEYSTSPHKRRRCVDHLYQQLDVYEVSSVAYRTADPDGSAALLAAGYSA
jgi:hypothetical protein